MKILHKKCSNFHRKGILKIQVMKVNLKIKNQISKRLTSKIEELKVDNDE